MTGLHVSQPAPHVVLIEIDNPPSNALGASVRERFIEHLKQIESDLDIRAVILTGRGKGFCAGDDLREAATRGLDALSSLVQFGALLDAIEGLRVPVIAAVNGHAIGGGLELALACDVRIASAEAFFMAAGVNIGLMASTYRLPRLVGIGAAKAMLLTGSRVDAALALSTGLVTAVHAHDDLLQAATDLAVRIASRAPLSVEAAKRSIDRAFDWSAQEAAAAALAELRTLVATKDHAAAVRAFLDRSDPVFTRS